MTTLSLISIWKWFARPGAVVLPAVSLLLSLGAAQADGVAGKHLGQPLMPSASALARAKPFGLPKPTTDQLKAIGVLNADGSVARDATRKSGTQVSSSAGLNLKGDAGSPEQDTVQVIPNSLMSNQTGPVAPMAYGDGDWAFSTSRVELTGKMLFSKVYPYRAAGKLFITLADGRTGWCSAALVRKGVLVTAAHCVSDFGSGFLDANWSFAPGYYNGKAAQKPVQAVYVVAPLGYLTGTDSCVAAGIVCPNDVAVIVLASSRGKYIGTKTGWFGVGYDGFGFTTAGETHVTQLGYPGGIDYGNQMLRNDSYGIVSGSGFALNTIIGSQMDQGSSGGPWIANFGVPGNPNGVSTPYDAQSNYIIGVTSWGNTDGINDVVGASPFTSGNIVALLADACTNYPEACAP